MALIETRERAAEYALDAIAKLQRDLDKVADAIRTASEGEPAISGDFTPNHQYIDEVVQYGAAFRALWTLAPEEGR